MAQLVRTASVLSEEQYNSNDGSDETKWESQSDASTGGKKRPPSTTHEANLDGTKKKSSRNEHGNDIDHINTQAHISISLQDMDSSNSITKRKVARDIETTGVGKQNKNINEGETNANKTFCDTKHCEKKGGEISLSSGNTNEIKSKSSISEEDLEMTGEGGDSEKNDDQNKHWKQFVEVVNIKAAPNLDAYINAKAIRNEASTRFVNEIDACMQTLRDTVNEITSDVVEPICNRYSDQLHDKEEKITKMMISNHLRRSKLMELMQDADTVWSDKYNKLTSEILGQNRAGHKGEIGEDIVGNKEKGDGEGETKNNSKGLMTAASSSEKSQEKVTASHEDPDWEVLLEYEPSREKIESFLEEQEKCKDTMSKFGHSLGAVHSGMESEVESILNVASDLFDQHETTFLESEEEIEFFIMENYERRGNLQKELEKSAQQAQGLFANLLSRLSQSAS